LERKSISVLSVLVLAIVGLSLISVPVAASGVGSWKTTSGYPTTAYAESCVVSGGYVYCVGGIAPSNLNNKCLLTSAVYFAPVHASGVGAWKFTTCYPTLVEYPSCVANGGYIFCVGGLNGGAVTDAVYFAPLSGTGVGTWIATSHYPANVYGQSCVVSGGYITCVAGATESVYLDAVYSAPLSSTGVGAWTESTNNYPLSVNVLSCVVSAGDIFCVGGVNDGSVTNAVYFASLSAGAVGAWSSTTIYPITNGEGYESCIAYVGVIYCVGGYNGVDFEINAVYFAPLSGTGVGTWIATTNYPARVDAQSCVLSAHTIFCVGGLTVSGPTSAVYFASV